MQMASHWTTLPIARNLAVRYQALRNAYMMVGRKRAAGRPMAETATQFLDAAKRIFDRLSEGTVRIHNHRVPINGDVAMLRWADDLHADERELLELYRKVTASLAGSQGIRCGFNAVNTGFRVMFGDVLFFTVTPDRRHSALLWRIMRSRVHDTGLLADDAATAWRRRYASPNTPSLYALNPENIAEEVSFYH
jgi:hypothetical protein